MARPVLYSFRRCPYAMRARLALQASGIICTHREILLRDKPEPMLRASPKGTVPVLVKDDGDVLEESLDVAFWALKLSDPEGWLRPWQADEAWASGLLARNDGPFKHHLDRYKYASRYEGEHETEHRDAGLEVLKDLNGLLEKTGFLYGQVFSFLDAGIAPFIRQFRIANPKWFDAQDLPCLQNWLREFMESERFVSVMYKYPVWDGGEDRHIFPHKAGVL
jgi:glutathione S-transferase